MDSRCCRQAHAQVGIRVAHGPLAREAVRKRCSAFTLVELLLTMVIAGIVLGGAAFMFANFALSFGEISDGSGQTVSDVSRVEADNDPITMAPAYSQLPAAMQLQIVLAEALQWADAVFVLGGDNESGTGPGTYPATLPSSTANEDYNWLAGVRPALAQAPNQFRNVLQNNGRWGDGFDPEGDGAREESFSIYVIGGRDGGVKENVTLVVHCRREDVGGLTTYSVDAFRPGSANADPNISYRFSMPSARTTQGAGGISQFRVGVGATHLWLRQDANWGIQEHLGTQVVFPDPTALPYDIGSADNMNAFSRFALFIPTHP